MLRSRRLICHVYPKLSSCSGPGCSPLFSGWTGFAQGMRFPMRDGPKQHAYWPSKPDHLSVNIHTTPFDLRPKGGISIDSRSNLQTVTVIGRQGLPSWSVG